MKYVVVGEREVDKSTGIISDQDIRLIGVRTSTYYPDNIRMVTCEDYATGNVYRFITNVFVKPEEQESLLFWLGKETPVFVRTIFLCRHLPQMNFTVKGGLSDVSSNGYKDAFM